MINMNNLVFMKKEKPSSLLPPINDVNLQGRWPVKIVCSYIRELFGRVGYTDFIDTEDGCVTMYFPSHGFVNLDKDCFME